MEDSAHHNLPGAPNPHYPPLPVNGNQYPFSHNVYNQVPPISTTATPPSRQPQVPQSPGHHTFNMGPAPQYLPPANKNVLPNHHAPLQFGPAVPAHQAMATNWNPPAHPQTSYPVTNGNFPTQHMPPNIIPVGRQTPGHVSNTNSSIQYMPTTPSPRAHPGTYPVNPRPHLMSQPMQSTPGATPPPGSVPPGVQRPRQQLPASNGQGFPQNYAPILNGTLMPASYQTNGYPAAGSSPQVPGHGFAGGHPSPQPAAPGNRNLAPRPTSAVPRHLTRFDLPSNNAHIPPRAVQVWTVSPSAAVNNNMRQGSSMPPHSVPPTNVDPTSMFSNSVPPTGVPPTSMPSTSVTPTSTTSTGTPSSNMPATSTAPTGQPSSSAPPASAPANGAPPTGVQMPLAANQTTVGTAAKRGSDQNLPRQPAKRQRKKAARGSATHQPPVTSTQQPGTSNQQPRTSIQESAPLSVEERLIQAFNNDLDADDDNLTLPDEPMHLPDYELEKLETTIVIEPEVGKPRPKDKTALAWEQVVDEIDELVKKHFHPGHLITFQQWYRLQDLSNAVEEFIARPGRRWLIPQEHEDRLTVRHIRVIEDGIFLGDFDGKVPNRCHEIYKKMSRSAKLNDVNTMWEKRAAERRETGPSLDEVQKQVYKRDKHNGSGSTRGEPEGDKWSEEHSRARLLAARNEPKPAPRQEPEDEEDSDPNVRIASILARHRQRQESENEEEAEEARRVHAIMNPKPWWQSGLPPK